MHTDDDTVKRSSAVSFRLAAEKLERLEKLAAATDRSRSWHIERALDAYLDLQAWQLARIEAGIDSIRRGRTVPHERVRQWLSTWGSGEESDPPA